MPLDNPGRYYLRGAGTRWFRRLIETTFGNENIATPPPAGQAAPPYIAHSVQPVLVVNSTPESPFDVPAIGAVDVRNPLDDQQQPIPLIVQQTLSTPAPVLNGLDAEGRPIGLEVTNTLDAEEKVLPLVTDGVVRNPVGSLGEEIPLRTDVRNARDSEGNPIPLVTDGGGGGGGPVQAPARIFLHGNGQFQTSGPTTLDADISGATPTGYEPFGILEYASFSHWGQNYVNMSGMTADQPLAMGVQKFTNASNFRYQALAEQRILAGSDINAPQLEAYPNLPFRMTSQNNIPRDSLVVTLYKGGSASSIRYFQVAMIVGLWPTGHAEYPYGTYLQQALTLSTRP